MITSQTYPNGCKRHCRNSCLVAFIAVLICTVVAVVTAAATVYFEIPVTDVQSPQLVLV